MNAPLLSSTKDGVRTLSFNRPARRNALSRDLLSQLQAALALAAQEEIRGIVLTGIGSCFSSGADIAELTGTQADVEFDDELSKITEAVRFGPYLVIAAINGACIGAAFDLACACDFRVAGQSATFEVPAVRLGLLYNPVAIGRMHRTIRSDAIRRLLLLGERLDARESQTAGIATHLVSDAEVGSTASAIAQKSAKSSSVLIATKSLLTTLDDVGLDMTRWQKTRMELLNSAERKSALKAAMDKPHR